MNAKGRSDAHRSDVINYNRLLRKATFKKGGSNHKRKDIKAGTRTMVAPVCRRHCGVPLSESTEAAMENLRASRCVEKRLRKRTVNRYNVGPLNRS